MTQQSHVSRSQVGGYEYESRFNPYAATSASAIEYEDLDEEDDL